MAVAAALVAVASDLASMEGSWVDEAVRVMAVAAMGA